MGVVWYTDVLMTFFIVMGPMVVLGALYEPQLNDGSWNDRKLELMAGSGILTVSFAYLMYLAWIKEGSTGNNAPGSTGNDAPVQANAKE